jgi:hypothetical protein
MNTKARTSQNQPATITIERHEVVAIITEDQTTATGSMFTLAYQLAAKYLADNAGGSTPINLSWTMPTGDTFTAGYEPAPEATEVEDYYR